MNIELCVTLTRKIKICCNGAHLFYIILLSMYGSGAIHGEKDIYVEFIYVSMTP